MNQCAKNWKDYEVLDTGNKEKLERWNSIILRRPDPVCVWPIDPKNPDWNKADAIYHALKAEVVTGKRSKKSKNFGRLVIADYALKSLRPVLSIPDFSRNRQPTGIL